jgi:uncharacterized protein YhbP (UPF0306 family)
MKEIREQQFQFTCESQKLSGHKSKFSRDQFSKLFLRDSVITLMDLVTLVIVTILNNILIFSKRIHFGLPVYFLFIVHRAMETGQNSLEVKAP